MSFLSFTRKTLKPFGLVACAVVAPLIVAPGVYAEVALVEGGRLDIYSHLNMDNYWADSGDESNLGVSSNATYIGLKGDYLIQPDNPRNNTPRLNAFWQVEQSVRLDESGDTFASRNSFLGLTYQNFDVQVGYFDTPYKAILDLANPLAYTLGDVRSVVGSGFFTAAQDPVFVDQGILSLDIRGKNALQTRWRANQELSLTGYYSADLVGNTGGDDNDLDLSSVAAQFSRDNFTLAAAFTTQEVGDRDGLRIVGRLDQGELVWGGVFETTSSDQGFGLDRSAVAGNVTYQWTDRDRLIGQLAVVQEDDDVNDSGATMIALGWYQALSSNLDLFGVLSLINNDSNGGYGMGFDRSDLIQPDATGDNMVGLSAGFRFML